MRREVALLGLLSSARPFGWGTAAYTSHCYIRAEHKQHAPLFFLVLIEEKRRRYHSKADTVPLPVCFRL